MLFWSIFGIIGTLFFYWIRAPIWWQIAFFISAWVIVLLCAIERQKRLNIELRQKEIDAQRKREQDLAELKDSLHGEGSLHSVCD